jgi:hypothetical protein
MECEVWAGALHRNFIRELAPSDETWLADCCNLQRNPRSGVHRDGGIRYLVGRRMLGVVSTT